jgi:sugar/nucleoside kinase (ribokinase family)
VTLAGDGGLMATAGQIFAASAERVEKPVDTTGAGDLLVAAYIWADLRGAEPLDRLRWAILYATLSVTTPTGIGGALDEDGLVEAGLARGLDVPPLVGAARN